MAKVILESVTKKFGDVVAVNDFNLDIPDKEFVVLVGPSGCGKSTTLRMIAGLEEVDRGKIMIGERVVNDVPPKDRDIAMVFQNYALYPHMNVYENMSFGLRLRKTPKREIDARVREAANLLMIEDLLKRRPKQLSGGQRQRVALGRAIVRKPLVFLMDEPLSNLDAKLRVQTRAEIAKLHLRLATTFIYVTHDQTEAMTMGDRIVIMKDGLILQVGTPKEVYEHPNNIFVAGFIGSPAMNFIKAKVADSHFIAGNMNIEASSKLKDVVAKNKLKDKDVIIGIRPEIMEDINFVPESGKKSTITSKVEVAEPMGNEVYLHVDIGGTLSIARVNPNTTADVGSMVTLALDIDRIHIFDPVSEETYY